MAEAILTSSRMSEQKTVDNGKKNSQEASQEAGEEVVLQTWRKSALESLKLASAAAGLATQLQQAEGLAAVDWP